MTPFLVLQLGCVSRHFGTNEKKKHNKIPLERTEGFSVLKKILLCENLLGKMYFGENGIGKGGLGKLFTNSCYFTHAFFLKENILFMFSLTKGASKTIFAFKQNAL